MVKIIDSKLTLDAQTFGEANKRYLTGLKDMSATFSGTIATTGRPLVDLLDLFVKAATKPAPWPFGSIIRHHSAEKGRGRAMVVSMTGNEGTLAMIDEEGWRYARDVSPFERDDWELDD